MSQSGNVNSTRSNKRRFSASKILQVLDLGNYLSVAKLRQHLLFLSFLVVIGILYIGNHHLADRNAKALIKSEKELSKLKWEHVSLKSELDQHSKQSSIARLVRDMGLREITQPPVKVSQE